MKEKDDFKLTDAFEVQDVMRLHGRLEHRCWIVRRIRFLRQRAAEKTDAVQRVV